MIILKNVNKYYETGGERVHAVRNLSVTFPDTGLAFILGPSGSGKSTLLNLLGGLDLPSEGEIWIEDKEISTFTSKERTNYLNSYLGFVFQEYNILKDLSLKENIVLPFEIQGYSRKKINEKFEQILNDVELTGLEKRKVNQLSGGQKQRVAIARALASGSNLILADEPTGNLDEENSENIFDILKNLAHMNNCCVIVVTHNLELATKADKVITLRSGRIIEE